MVCSPFLFFKIANHPSYIQINQVRNEIAVLKRISSGHRNIVTLHDYFEVCVCALIQADHKKKCMSHISRDLLLLFTDIS